jgi:hypothetical protein
MHGILGAASVDGNASSIGTYGDAPRSRDIADATDYSFVFFMQNSA